ncbi:MAG TPA: glycoside hydrolase family 28 protein [Bacteroidales bacterium]|nr:glycoside hydrolase family 28 protein [Bacteroidales bacterium]
MKRIILPLCFLLVIALCSCTGSDRWKMAADIENAIIKTSFPADTFSIVDFGAVSGDTSFLNTEAIEAAIIKCNNEGGGVVLIPEGTWTTGPVTLLSNVNLHISEHAILLFSTRYNLYLPAVLTRWEGMDCYNIHPLVYAIDASNIALTGKGTIDGQASNEIWWWMNGNPEYGWKEGMNSQKLAGRPELLGYEQNQTPVEERCFGIEGALRPQLVNFMNCTSVLIEDLTLKNSPFWVIHPVRTESLIMRGVTIKSAGPNSDGCDPESCNNVLIEKCFFDTGDDCIAIKSGRNNDGRRWNIPSRNIIVRDCRMAAGHGGVVIGSEITGGYSNLFVENCEMDSPELLRVIRIKTSECRGGVIENINVRNVKVGVCSEAVLHITLNYEPGEPCVRDFPPVVRNVTLENVTSNKSKYGIYIEGLDKSVNVSDITLRNCAFNGVEQGTAITGAEGVKLKKVYINGKKIRR